MFNQLVDIGSDAGVMQPECQSIIPYKGAVLLAAAVQDALTNHYRQQTRGAQAEGIARQVLARARPDALLNDITEDELAKFVTECQANRNANSTINIKLSFYSVLFRRNRRKLLTPEGTPLLRPEIPWLPDTKTVKWWLNASIEPKVLEWLNANGCGDTADYVQWTTNSGLRIQENLRLQKGHFDFTTGSLTVPGTKTVGAQRTIPLFAKALEIAQARFALLPDRPDTYLFTFVTNNYALSPARLRQVSEVLDGETDLRVVSNYGPLRATWARVRDVFGWQKNRTATLKALRRSFAKRATDNGMPTAVLQQYLGHEDIETTMEYLRVVGGYNLDVMRQWVT